MKNELKTTLLSTEGILKKGYLRLGLAISLCYMGCYLGKTILSAFTPRLTQLGVFVMDDIGTMGFALFLAYGAGQLINGIMGDRLNPKYFAALGLFCASLLVAFSPFAAEKFTSVTPSIALWASVGFFSSMMWGPLTLIVAENSSGDKSRKLMIALNGSLVAGTMLAYLISAVVSAVFDNWRIAFFCAGGYMALCSAAFFIILSLLERKNLIVCAGGKKKKLNALRSGQKEKLTVKLLLKHAFFTTVILNMINGYVRNAVSFWIPTYIKESFGVSDSFAAGVTMIMPVLNFVGTVIGLMLMKTKLFKGSEHILCAALSGFTLLMFGVVYLLGATGVSSLAVAVICVFFASAAQNSVCNLIYAVFVFRFKDTGKISSLTGGLDSSAYVASAVGTKTIGSVASAIGWNNTVGVWGIVTAFGLVAGAASAFICKKNGVLNGGFEK